MSKFWNWVKDEDVRTLVLDGVIAEESWWGDEVTPAQFKDELMQGDGDIKVYLNSPGGDCVAASQIYTALMEYPHNVDIIIDGMAASAASVIAMAGTKVTMAPTAMMMIHDPLTEVYGNTGEMYKAIALLEEVKEGIINAYQIKTGLPREEISNMMSAETWMNAYKALEMGFCDEILGNETEKNGKSTHFSFDFSSKQTARALLNKLSINNVLSSADSEDSVQSTDKNTATGISVADTEARLNALYYQI